MCQMLVSSYLFPFHQLYPQINKIWLDPTKQLKCWGKMSFSPGEENLFLLYYTQFRQSITNGLIPPNASVIEFMRDNGWLFRALQELSLFWKTKYFESGYLIFLSWTFRDFSFKGSRLSNFSTCQTLDKDVESKRSRY